MKYKFRTLSGPQNINREDYLNASMEIYSWLESKSIEGNHGKYFQVNPGGLTDYGNYPVHGKYALYSGSSGIGFFLLRLYDITRDEKYLQEAESIADELIANVQGSEFYKEKLETAQDSDLKVTGWHTGVYSGPSGAGILALELYSKTNKQKYLAFAKKLGMDIIQASKRTSQGLTLTGDLDLFSDGGFVLYFISLYRATDNKEYLNAATEYARYIYEKRENGIHGGEFYHANELGKVGMPDGSIYPGFSHGTAGIGYMFAVLYEADGREWEISAAIKTAEFLESIADKVGDGILIPYIYGGKNSDNYANKYYLGFCHGPAGTALLYRKLYQITGDEKYKKTVIALAEGIISSGAPEYNSWGLWNSYCLCCGTPGLIEFFTEMYEFTGDEKYLKYARRSAAKTIADSTETEEGITFYGHWDRTNNRDIQSYTGLYTGASGAASGLLRLYANEIGENITSIWEYSYLYYIKEIKKQDKKCFQL